MYPESSDDKLLYLIRRNNKKAYKLLLSRYETFILKWLSEYNLKIDFKDCLFNQCILLFESSYSKYDDSKGVFYSYIQRIVKRHISTKIGQYNEANKYFEPYCNEEYASIESYKLNDAVYYELNNFPKYEYIYLFTELENKVIKKRVVNNMSYKEISETLNITIRKVEYILTKYHKYKQNMDKKKNIF